MGRPSSYKPEYAEKAYKLCLLGAKDKEIADFFEVDERTINRWKADHEEFCQSLKDGKEDADGVIAESLFHRAKGYSHAEDKIFQHNGEPVVVPTTKHYPPDTTAAIFWLKNRQGRYWRDAKEVGVTASIEAAPDVRELGRAILAVLGGALTDPVKTIEHEEPTSG